MVTTPTIESVLRHKTTGKLIITCIAIISFAVVFERLVFCQIEKRVNWSSALCVLSLILPCSSSISWSPHQCQIKKRVNSFKEKLQSQQHNLAGPKADGLMKREGSSP